MQRVGRASHHVGGTSAAVIFPKYRGDLVACAAITRAMYAGKVESVHYPRNPLDVLAQQIVAMVAMDPWNAGALFTLVRQAAPYAALTRGVFDSVLDMLSGRYPSDEFAELRPRLTWDRATQQLTSRQGARNVAVINGGTIPDRGLFTVYLAGATRGARVGELDEEMVFESRAGDTIILGATTWRIDQITHDRVTVTPAPGEPGKMPFWHGDGAGRPAEFGREIGEMTRELLATPRAAAFTRLVEEHSLDANAAENLLRYLEDQTAATGRVPSDRDIVIERCRDELGDFRVCVLTPFGSRVHAPWCMAVTAKLRAERGVEVETMWSDDGFVIRLPETEEPLETEWLLPAPAELKDLVLRQLGSTSLFAAKFREAAARALLLPRRRPGIRAPLWQQRKRAADLLAVASRFSSFPMLLETYRECVREVFDLEAATAILQQVQRGTIRVTAVDSAKPSPYASALLFSYIANYIYDGDAPLAERRAQALSIDQSQLEEILGSTDFRELLDKAALAEVEQQLQALDPDYQARHTDGLHDLLLRLGDLSLEEIQARSTGGSITELTAARRAVRVRIAGETRFIPVEYAARYRDAVGVPLPPGLAGVFLEAHRPPALRTAPPLRAHPRTLHHRRRRDALRPGALANRTRAPPPPRRWKTARRRVPPRGHAPRMVRPRRAPAGPPQDPRPPAPRGGPRRTAHLRPPAHPLAGRRRPAPRPRRPARHHRDPARRRPDRLRPGARDPARARARLQPQRSRRPDGLRQRRVDRPRTTRRSRRPHRALPRRCAAAPARRRLRRPSSPSARSASPACSARWAHRSSRRSIRPPAAASPAIRRPLSGNSCGRAS